MSDIVDRIKITSVDGPYDIWSRNISFDYDGTSYWITLEYHGRDGLSWQWFDESQNKIETPTWLSDDEYDFYSDLGDEARTW